MRHIRFAVHSSIETARDREDDRQICRRTGADLDKAAAKNHRRGGVCGSAAAPTPVAQPISKKDARIVERGRAWAVESSAFAIGMPIPRAAQALVSAGDVFANHASFSEKEPKHACPGDLVDYPFRGLT